MIFCQEKLTKLIDSFDALIKSFLVSLLWLQHVLDYMLPNTGLGNSYALRHDVIDSVVTRKSPGVYVLGYLDSRDMFIVCYVGRSDVDVATRLKSYIDSDYIRFKFKYFDSPKAAFEKECVI